MDGVALGEVEGQDNRRLGGGQVHHGLVRFNLHEGLVHGDALALLDQPGHEDALVYALSHIGELEFECHYGTPLKKTGAGSG